MRREPHAAQRERVPDNHLDDPYAGAVTDHVRVHHQLEEAALAVCRLKLPAEDVEPIRRRRIRRALGLAMGTGSYAPAQHG